MWPSCAFELASPDLKDEEAYAVDDYNDRTLVWLYFYKFITLLLLYRITINSLLVSL
jgi:hypothetical protein